MLYLVKSGEDTLAAVELDRSQAVIHEIRETPGQWLYHYTTLETALVHILPEQRLRLSPFSRMRDPREYKRLSPPASGFIGDVSEEDLMRGYAATEARLNLLRDEFKLLSFTTDSESATEGVYGRGFARSRLWEAYAGLGSGVCIVLRKQDALEVIRPQLEAFGRSAHGPEHALRHFANELEIGLGFVQWDNNDPILMGRPLQRKA